MSLSFGNLALSFSLFFIAFEYNLHSFSLFLYRELTYIQLETSIFPFHITNFRNICQKFTMKQNNGFLLDVDVNLVYIVILFLFFGELHWYFLFTWNV